MLYLLTYWENYDEGYYYKNISETLSDL